MKPSVSYAIFLGYSESQAARVENQSGFAIEVLL